MQQIDPMGGAPDEVRVAVAEVVAADFSAPAVRPLMPTPVQITAVVTRAEKIVSPAATPAELPKKLAWL